MIHPMKMMIQVVIMGVAYQHVVVIVMVDMVDMEDTEDMVDTVDMVDTEDMVDSEDTVDIKEVIVDIMEELLFLFKTIIQQINHMEAIRHNIKHMDNKSHNIHMELDS